mmetsp:Transcript_9901/g.21764  ORF Transcript_9901/g.21764 Transcript_9901/m.21764 type:complete len:234 (-) Transcript_9901:157-858(-)
MAVNSSRDKVPSLSTSQRESCCFSRVASSSSLVRCSTIIMSMSGFEAFMARSTKILVSRLNMPNWKKKVKATKAPLAPMPTAWRDSKKRIQSSPPVVAMKSVSMASVTEPKCFRRLSEHWPKHVSLWSIRKSDVTCTNIRAKIMRANRITMPHQNTVLREPSIASSRTLRTFRELTTLKTRRRRVTLRTRSERMKEILMPMLSSRRRAIMPQSSPKASTKSNKFHPLSSFAKK